MENTTKALLLLIALAVMAVLYVVLIVWIIKKILKRKNSGKPPLSGKQIFRRIYIVFSVCNLLVSAWFLWEQTPELKPFLMRMAMIAGGLFVGYHLILLLVGMLKGPKFGTPLSDIPTEKRRHLTLEDRVYITRTCSNCMNNVGGYCTIRKESATSRCSYHILDEDKV